MGGVMHEAARERIAPMAAGAHAAPDVRLG
jgi:hypothetical protein